MFVEYVLILENLFAVMTAQLLFTLTVWVMKDNSLEVNGNAISAKFPSMASANQ
jgi:hypothetical protein